MTNPQEQQPERGKNQNVPDKKPNNIIISILLYIYVTTRRFLNVSWIRLNRWISQPDRIVSSLPSTTHKTVVIGDGFAFGAGDSIIAGGDAGVVSYLATASHVDAAIRRNWKFVNRGELNSTSDMWLPGELLFEKVFGNKSPGRDADVVIIMMGTSDVLQGKDNLPPAATRRDMLDLPYPKEEIATVSQNIHKIATFLQKENKRVCVVDMPTLGVPNAGRGHMKRLNQQLKQLLIFDPKRDQSNTKKEDESIYPIQFVGLGNNHRIMRSEFRCYDSLHLNWRGYRSLAGELFNNGVKTMMVNAEWGVWKGILKKDGLPFHEKAIEEGKLQEEKKTK